MSKKPTLATVLSGYYSNTALNSNFDAIETAFENTLSLDGSTPNAMEADFDLNDNDILNAGSVYASHLYVSGIKLTDAVYVPNWEGEWVTATSYTVNDIVRESGSAYICLVAHTSGTFATDLTANYWELFAVKGSAGAGTGDLLSTNNLSDLTSAASARSNLGLGSIAVEAAPSGTVVGTTDTQTLTNKTLTSPTINVTSDATGDIYYRTAGGAFERLGIGSTDQVLTVASGLPSWITPSTISVTEVSPVSLSGAGPINASTSIPSGVYSVVLYIDGASLSGSENLLVQLSTGSTFVTSGYRAACEATTSTTGAILEIGAASETLDAALRFEKEPGSNTWLMSGSVLDGARSRSASARVDLGGTLDGIRVGVTGSDTFDAGQVSLRYYT